MPKIKKIRLIKPRIMIVKGKAKVSELERDVSSSKLPLESKSGQLSDELPSQEIPLSILRQSFSQRPQKDESEVIQTESQSSAVSKQVDYVGIRRYSEFASSSLAQSSEAQRSYSSPESSRNISPSLSQRFIPAHETTQDFTTEEMKKLRGEEPVQSYRDPLKSAERKERRRYPWEV